MIVTGEDIFKLYCTWKKEKQGKVQVQVASCTFPPTQLVDSVLYEGVTGLTLTVIVFLFHLLVFWLNRYIKKDFVKCFTTAIAVPLTVGTFCRFFQILFTLIYDPWQYFIVEIFSHMYTVCLTTTFITAYISIGCFLFMHAVVLCSGKSPNMEDSWSLFLTIEIVGWILSGCYVFTSTDYRKLPAYALLSVMGIFSSIIIIAVIATIISICACGSRYHKSEDPIVKTGTFRAFWSILSILVVVPAFLAMSYFNFDLEFITAFEGDMDPKQAAENFFSYRILEFIAGPYMIICILLLPTYREAIFLAANDTKSTSQNLMNFKGSFRTNAPLLAANQRSYPVQPKPKAAA